MYLPSRRIPDTFPGIYDGGQALTGYRSFHNFSSDSQREVILHGVGSTAGTPFMSMGATLKLYARRVQ